MSSQQKKHTQFATLQPKAPEYSLNVERIEFQTGVYAFLLRNIQNVTVQQSVHERIIMRQNLLSQLKALAVNKELHSSQKRSKLQQLLTTIQDSGLFLEIQGFSWFLMQAIFKNESDEVIKFLIRCGCKVFVDMQGTSALHLAAFRKRITIVDELLPLVKTNFSDQHGLSVFHLACLSRNVYQMQRFIDSGADVNRRCQMPESIHSRFHFWSEDFHADFKDLELCGKSGLTPLHLCMSRFFEKHQCQDCQCERYKSEAAAVRLLLLNGADPNAKNSSGETPLQIAVARYQYDVVKELLDFKADLNMLVVDQPQTFNHCRHCSLKSILNFFEILQLFESKGMLLSPMKKLQHFKNFIRPHLYLHNLVHGWSFSKNWDTEFHDDTAKAYYKMFVNFDEQVKKAFKLMSQTKIKNQQTLCDIYKSNPDEVYPIVVNSNYWSVVNSRDFDNDYFLYSRILVDIIAKSFVRRYCEILANEFLPSLVELSDASIEYSNIDGLIYLCDTAADAHPNLFNSTII
ncbi:uncharacterized protein LOC106660478 [Trichogramma pretiosum]|uniref:uncharacterized protein LOC106660478 n=1 Tax=Trichogramma pretiosum TaxID=7493 RepID=UPI0006C9D9DB|nr:uncharacterized protein LOC106660478 [Trichogramma pretiosum]